MATTGNSGNHDWVWALLAGAGLYFFWPQISALMPAAAAPAADAVDPATAAALAAAAQAQATGASPAEQATAAQTSASAIAAAILAALTPPAGTSTAVTTPPASASPSLTTVAPVVGPNVLIPGLVYAAHSLAPPPGVTIDPLGGRGSIVRPASSTGGLAPFVPLRPTL